MTIEEWAASVRKRHPWMTDDQFECYRMICDVYCGEHHLPGKVRPFGDGVEVNHYGDLSTYDFNRLTCLVLLAHDRCIRVEIGASGPRRVKLMLHRRHVREGGSVWDRHPTIERALEIHRKSFAAPMEIK